MRLLAAIVAFLSLAAGLVSPRAQEAPAVDWHGLQVVSVTPELMTEHGLAVPFGAFVQSLRAGSPADNAGLAAKDVIVAAGTTTTATRAALLGSLNGLAPGAQLELSVLSPGRAARKVALQRPGSTVPPPIVAQTSREQPVLMLDTRGHMAPIKSVIFTHDGKELVSAGDDKVIRVWDIATGRTTRTIRGQVGPGNEGRHFTTVLSPVDRNDPGAGHRWLATAGWTHPECVGRCGDIRLYDFASGQLVHLMQGHTDVVLGLAFSPDGSRLVSGSADRTAIVWDVGSGRALRRLETHSDFIYSVAFSPDGRRIVTASDDRRIALWDANSGSLIASMPGNSDMIRSVLFSRANNTIMSLSYSGDLQVWNGSTGAPIRSLGKTPNNGGRLALSPDGKTLLASTVGYYGPWPVDALSVENGRRLSRYSRHDNIVVGVGISPDGRTAASADFLGQIHLWDIQTGRPRVGRDGAPVVLRGAGSTNWSAAFSSDGRSIAWGHTNANPTGSTPINERGPLEFRMRLPAFGERLGHPEPITAEKGTQWLRGRTSNATMSLNTRSSASYQAAILDIWRDNKVVASVERGTSDGYDHRSYSFTPDDRSIISGGNNGTLTSYDLAGRKLGDFIGHDSEVWSAVPSPDGRLLVSASGDQTVRLWNFATRELLVTMFHGRDGEWVMWTPQGYFTGSPNAGQLVGWQQNHGYDKEASYVRAEMLRHVLRRPDIVERAIVAGSARTAVAELAKDGPSLEQLVQRPPPDVVIAGDTTSATGRVRLVMEVERTGRAVDAFDVHVGDFDAVNRFVPERKLAHRPVQVPSDYRPIHQGRDLHAFEVDLRRGANWITVIARTDAGETIATPTRVMSTVDLLGERAGTLRILSIGIDQYPTSQPYPRNLTLAGKDAREFAATAARVMGRRHERIVSEVMVNGAGGQLEPTKANIEAALRRLAGVAGDASSRQKDTVMLFIAGHGESRRGQYVLLPTDFRRRDGDDPGENVVEWHTIRSSLANAPGQRAVFLDTCHAGNSYNDGLVGDAKSLSFAAFTAAKAESPAAEDPALGHGRFTFAVKSGLEGGALRGKVVRVYDLGSYVADKVEEISKGAQIAEFYPGAGNFVLVQQ